MVATFQPSDPLFNSQWHFALIGRLGFGSGNGTEGLERIWAEFTGAGVYVGIWDDGVERAHWDLDARYDQSRHVSVGGIVNDGQPLNTTARHGTAVAGLIAAENNGQGGVGVAFNATITSVRIFGGSDDINANWGRYLVSLDGLQAFDVTNHSYGGTPDFRTSDDVAKFEAAAALGRGGLGTINIKSAGNSNIDGNGEWIDASRFTVTVAAVGLDGNAASYSTYGSHVLVSAPAGSVTTDRLGSAGYNGLLAGDYTNAFGGTSAAGPITAGVVTLMLDANPELGWRDVQNILAYSAIGTGSLYGGSPANENHGWSWNGAANWNGGGLHYSEDYGFGIVNAFNAVRMAEVWSVLHPAAATSANELSVTTGTLAVNRPIADLSTLTYTFDVAQNINLDHVTMTVTLSHSYFTDLRLCLISPDETVISLYDGSSGNASTADGLFSYSFGIDGLRGETSAGTWTLQVQDAELYDAGTLYSICFTGYGSAISTDDVYHYTDEVLTVLSQPGQAQRAILTDLNGGVDWIDAAAMVRDLVLYLDSASGSTAGGVAFLTIADGSLIENAIGGDGDDQIYGNELDNVLYGMRGDDVLDGGEGVDTAAYLGLYADYGVTTVNGVTTVSSLVYGIDTLTNIEFLRFADQTIAVPSIPETPSDHAGPFICALSPDDDASDVECEALIVLTFDEIVAAGTGDIVIHNIDGSVWGRFNVNGTEIRFSDLHVIIDPLTPFAAGNAYYVNIDAGAIVDLSGNPFEGISGATAFNFATQIDAGAIAGTPGNDILFGTAGDDRLSGLSGKDTLYGYDGDDVIDGGAGNDAMRGGRGNDTYLVDSAKDKVLELKDEGIDTVITSLKAYALGSNVENLVFKTSMNVKGSGNKLDNEITGGEGNDILNGMAGSDVLVGGSGADRFVFSSVSHTSVGAGRDQIMDFEPGVDVIDLSLIDANGMAKGLGAFDPQLVGNFTGVAGQLRLTASGPDIIVAGDIDGNGVADFEILVCGVSTLSANDFIL